MILRALSSVSLTLVLVASTFAADAPATTPATTPAATQPPALGPAPTPDAMGAGAHQYRWVKDWATLPGDVTFGGTHGCIVIDSQDRVYVNTEGEYAVLVFSPAGKLIGKWGQDHRKAAHGMCLFRQADGTEVIWLAHFAQHTATKFSLDGKILQTITYPHMAGMYTKADEFKPTAVAVAPNGDVYVTDGYGKGWVHQFHADGSYVRSWNGSAGAAGIFKTPHGIGVDTRFDPPQVVVADRANHRLQRFTLNGDYLGVVNDLRLPCKVIFGGDDVVVPDLQGRVTIFDKNFQVVTQLGDNPDPKLRGNYKVKPEQWQDGAFLAPHGAAWDSKGNLYVEDWNQTGRVTRLERKR